METMEQHIFRVTDGHWTDYLVVSSSPLLAKQQVIELYDELYPDNWDGPEEREEWIDGLEVDDLGPGPVLLDHGQID